MSAAYHIRIKQDYAVAVIEDLLKNNALEVVPEAEAFEVPEWQPQLVQGRITHYKNSPNDLMDEDQLFAFLDKE